MDAAQIHQAFCAGDLEALRLLLGAEFPRGPAPLAFRPYLRYAILHSPRAFVAELLARGAEPDAHEDGFPSLIAALASGREDRLELVETLLAAGADLHQRGLNDWTPLHFAAAHDDVAAIRFLLAKGADPKLRTRIDDGLTPLEEARALGCLRAAAALAERLAVVV